MMCHTTGLSLCLTSQMSDLNQLYIMSTLGSTLTTPVLMIKILSKLVLSTSFERDIKSDENNFHI